MTKTCFIALLGLLLLLLGCDEYPGKIPTGAVKMTPKLYWIDAVGLEPAIGGDCHIESINDKATEERPVHTVKESGDAMKVVGWAAISAKIGIVANHIAIGLKSKTGPGSRIFASATRGKRPDVAAYFMNPGSLDTGFSAVLDLSDVPPGEYLLELIQHRDGKNYQCQQTSILDIER